MAALTLAQMQQAIDAVASCGTVLEASKRLNIPRGTLECRLRAAWRQKVTPSKHIEDLNNPLHLRSKIKRLEADLSTAQRQLFEKSDHLDQIKRLIHECDETPTPPKWVCTPLKGTNTGVPTLFASDWHWDEVVDPKQINGINAYNRKIAMERAKRLFTKTVDLLVHHMARPSYDYFVLNLGGDMLCFPEGTPVTDANGRAVPIEHVQPGMRVMGNPHEQRVAKVHVRDPKHGETLLQVRCSKLPRLEATPGHVVAILPREVVETGWNPGGRRAGGFTIRDKSLARASDIIWSPLATVRPGDYLVNRPERPTDHPDRLDLREVTRLPLSQDGRKLLRKVRGRSPCIISDPILTVDNDLLWAIGLFIAEGSYQEGRSGQINCANVTLGIHERHLAERWVDIISRQFGYLSSIRENPKHSTTVIHCNNQIIATFLHELVGRHAHRVSISPRLFRMNRSLLPLVAGWMDGDGSLDSSGLFGKTVSPALAQQMVSILNVEHCLPSYTTDDHGLHRTAHIVRVSGESAQLLGSYSVRFADQIKEVRPTYTENLTFDGYIGYRVKSVVEVPVTKKLYDLTIEGEPYYQAGGVLVHNSGNIHEELRETNEAPVSKSILSVMDALVAGIDTLQEHFPRIVVNAVPGNHGRWDKKPRAKNRVYETYEWLLYQFLAKYYRDNKDLRFNISDGSDLPYNIYSTRFLLTHGDQFRGGSGIAGALSPLMLGDARKRKRAIAIDQPFDYLIMGHWHQLMMVKGIICNGSLKGADEYSFQENFDFELPQQALFVTHPVWGITARWPVILEKPGVKFSFEKVANA